MRFKTFNIACLLLLSSAICNAQAVFTVTLSEAMTNTMIAAMFPRQIKIEKSVVYLRNPRIVFMGQERLGLSLDLDARHLQQAQSASNGQAMMSGRLNYDAENSKFSLQDPQLETLVMDGQSPDEKKLVKDLEAHWTKSINEPIEIQLPENSPVYAYRTAIKNVTVGSDAINLLVQFP